MNVKKLFRLNQFSVGMTHLISKKSVDSSLGTKEVAGLAGLRLQEPLGLLVDRHLQGLTSQDFALRLKLFERTKGVKFEVSPKEEAAPTENLRQSMNRHFQSKQKMQMLTGMLSTQMMTGKLEAGELTLLQNNDWKLSALSAFFNAKLDFVEFENRIRIESSRECNWQTTKGT